MFQAISELPTLAASYSFWSQWWMPKSTDFEHWKPVKQLNFRTANKNDLLGLNHGTCPLCNNTELKRFPEPYTFGSYQAQQVFCACLVLHQAGRRYSIESMWKPRKVSDLHPIGRNQTEIDQIKSSVATFVMELGGWVYLYGGYGSGKTHLAWAIKNALRGLALYINAGDLAGELRSAAGRFEDAEMINEIVGAPVLIIDDLGVEKSSEFLSSALYSIINRRYAMGVYAPTFITSNVSQDELTKHTDDNYRRIASRLNDRELVLGLVTNQPDYRSMAR